MGRTDSLGKTLILGKIEGRRRREWQRMSWLDGITDSMDMSLNKLLKIVKNREAWHAGLHEIAKIQTQLSSWTTTMEVPSRRGWWQILLRNVPWNYVSVRVGESPREILNRICLTEKRGYFKIPPLDTICVSLSLCVGKSVRHFSWWEKSVWGGLSCENSGMCWMVADIPRRASLSLSY